MPALDVTFVNAALTRCGLETIASFDDVNDRAKVANANYEVKVLAALDAHRWHFATKTEILSQLEDDAPDPWLYAYQLPTDAKTIRSVKQAGINIDYELMGSKILTLVNNDLSEVVAHFGWRPPEAQWPPWWTEALIQRLEAVFLRFKEQHAEAKARDEAAEAAFQTARRLDSQNQPPADPYTYPILAARRG